MPFYLVKVTCQLRAHLNLLKWEFWNTVINSTVPSNNDGGLLQRKIDKRLKVFQWCQGFVLNIKVIELGLYIKGVLWDIQDLLVFRPSGRKDIESLLAGEFSFERNQDNIGDSDHSSSRIMMGTCYFFFLFFVFLLNFYFFVLVFWLVLFAWFSELGIHGAGS